MIQNLLDLAPDTGAALFVAWNAHINGDVVLGRDSSVWYGCTLRGDTGPIRVGDQTNVQDGSILHNSAGTSLTIGNRVTVGHGVILHGCTVGDNCLIGMGSVILDRAVIGENSIVGAGSLVTQGKIFPPGSLIVGSPARLIRSLTPDEIERNQAFCERNIKHARENRASGGETLGAADDPGGASPAP
ncbi:MAG: gamma carbonic anhydrase family protein [Spirochaetales bacterium]|jgi:carbonic anhydrase/acetyltransferase-like protein (isoleucine patch superfamily)|nr:gamma carbonic anhydrase family protein [Spirochaetales bacterium]